MLAATAVATAYTSRIARHESRDHLVREADTTVQAIDRRMAAHGEVLRALRGLFQIDPHPSLDRFRKFVHSLRVEERYPGVRALSFARAVDSTQLASFDREARRRMAESTPAYSRFAIHPRGRRPHYVAVEYIEPLATNKAALGFDLLSEPARARATRSSQSSGQAAATAPLRVVQDRVASRALLLMLAVRDVGGSLASRRTGRFQGVVTGAFHVQDLIGSILGTQKRDFDLEIYDVGASAAASFDQPSRANSIYDLDHRLEGLRRPDGLHGTLRSLDVAGRRWVVYYALRGVAAPSGLRGSWWVAIGGTLASLLAAFLALTLARGRVRALEIAGRITRDLELSEHQTRQILETANDAFVAIDAHGLITDWNPRAEETFGWSRDEALGRDLAETIIPEGYRAAHRRGMERFVKTGETKIGETLLELPALHRDGREFPIELTISPLRTAGGYSFNAFLRDITERKATARLLESRHEQLTEAQSLAALGSWEWDVATDTIEWSDELCRIFGVEPGTYPASFEEYLQHIHPDDRATAEAVTQAAYSSGEPFSFDHRIVLTDATERVVHSIGRVVMGDDGQPLRMLGTAQDITERKATEAELRRSSRYFELSRDMICTAGLDGYFKQLNSAWTRALGWSESELLSRPFAEFVHPDDREITVQESSKLAIGGTTVAFVNRYETKSGDWRWLEWNAMSEPDLGLIYASARDVTERKVAEDRIQRSERLHTALLDSAPDAVVIVGEDGGITLVNERAERLFGYERDELIGSPIEKLLPKRGHERHTAGRCKNGTEFPVDISVSAIDTDEGRLVTAFVRDVTERKRTESELAAAHEKSLEASRLMSEFVANMSHEIRTPLNGVIGLGELLLSTELSDEQREYAEGVSESGEALMSLIGNILDFSKIEAGKLDLDSHNFHLRELVDGVSLMLATPTREKNLELMADVDADVPDALYGDSTRIRQVLANLTTNAVKFTETGEVVLRATLEPGDGDDSIEVRFAVSDTGIGVESGLLDGMFDAFSQADSSTSRRYGGTGLGLAISKQLVELMGGRIGAQSEPGQGSTFWFTVPLGVRESQAPVSSSEFAGIRALIVDDNATNRTILEHQLAAWGLSCDAAAGSDQAMDLLQAAVEEDRPYGLAMLDYNMPGRNGAELAHAIKALPALRSVRLLMMSSSQPERDVATNAGIDGVVTKPIRHSRLREEIARVLALETGARRVIDAGPHPSPPRRRASTGRLVLAVEDNTINQLLVVRMLEARGFRVDVAANGREAVEMHQDGEYEIIFMDCQMPELDGYQATAAIRRREAADRHTPIVAMTANTLKGDRERCLAAGMDDYLGKPLRPTDLDEVIARALRGSAGANGSRERPAAEVDAQTEDTKAPLVDASILADVFGGDAAARDDLVAQFIRRSRATIAELALAVEAGEMATVARLAHGLKGSATAVGAERLSRTAGQLCEVLAAGQPTDAPSLQTELEDIFEMTDTAFNSSVNEATT